MCKKSHTFQGDAGSKSFEVICLKFASLQLAIYFAMWETDIKNATQSVNDVDSNVIKELWNRLTSLEPGLQ